MMSSSCPMLEAVLEAHSRGVLMGEPALFEHVGTCVSCGQVLFDEMLSPQLDTALAGLRAGSISENEVAFHLAEGFTSALVLDELSADDRARVEAAETELIELQRAEVRTSSHRWRRSVWPVAVLATVAAAAAVALVVIPGTLFDPPVGKFRGSRVGLELALGDARCGPGRISEMNPCPWESKREPLTLHVRVEPHAKARHVVVLARDVLNDITVLYPDDEIDVRPLEVTRGRASKTCRDALCWLEGGHYEVPAGRVSVIAVFTEEPHDPAAVAASWTRGGLNGTARHIDRFELEALP